MRKVTIICCLGLLLIGANTLIAQPRGHALAFDGVDDYVEVADAPSLAMTDGLTIAAWVYISDYVEWASVVTKGFDNNYTLHQSGPNAASGAFGRIRFTGLGVAPFIWDSNTQIPLDEWHFVAVTFDGTSLRFYLDGMPDGIVNFATPATLAPNNQPLFIGVDPPGATEFWNGQIDEVRIWNTALKPGHIRAAMNGHAAPKASALVGYWRFDEGSGPVAGDRSREKNDGALKNGPTWVTPGAPIGNAGKLSAAESEAQVVDQFVLAQNYPNPFNPSTTIRLELPAATTATLRIFSRDGQLVRTLASGDFESGSHQFTWDGTNDSGKQVASGVYLYQFTGGQFTQTRHMLLLK